MKQVKIGKLSWLATAQRLMSQEESTGGRAASLAQGTTGTPWKSPMTGRAGHKHLPASVKVHRKSQKGLVAISLEFNHSQ